MATAAHYHRPLRFLAVASGGFSLVVALVAATSPSSPRGAAAHAAAGARAAVSGGSWGQAEQVPGTAALNKGGFAQVTSVSCARAGSCGAGGFYTDASGHFQAFVVDET